MDTSENSPRALAWFRKVDYDDVLRVMVDRDSLPRDFESWEQQALMETLRLDRAGEPFFKAYISPYSFERWCKQRGCLPDAAARAEFVAYVGSAVLGSARPIVKAAKPHRDEQRRHLLARI